MKVAAGVHATFLAPFYKLINGFSFNRDLPPNFGLKIVITPTKRIGWVNGVNVNQLQQSFY